MEEVRWKTLEYRHTHKTNDWYWAVGITAIALIITSILTKNFLFAIFIILGTIMIFYFAKRHPEEHEAIVNRRGVMVGEILYPTDSIKHFWIDHSSGESKLLLMSSRLLNPIISIALDEGIEEEVRQILSAKILEKQISEPKHWLVMEKLGF